MVNSNNAEKYGNKVRTRVCGILIQEHKILLLNHTGLNPENTFWSPPGGGIEFGETIEQTLKREFQEEVSLKIEVKQFLFLNEHIASSLHAIELFYIIESQEEPSLGKDPELDNSLLEMKWFSQKELNLIPNKLKHSIFNQNPSLIQHIIKKR